ncbi:hypothetical protein V6N13_069336 [Hibiscus sabdariffa]
MRGYLTHKTLCFSGGGWDPTPPRAMKIQIWNCRGLGNCDSVQALRQFIAVNNPELVFLCETRLYKNKSDPVMRQLGMTGCLDVEWGDSCVGLMILWQDSIQVTLRSYSRWHIDVEVNDGSPPFRFTGDLNEILDLSEKDGEDSECGRYVQEAWGRECGTALDKIALVGSKLKVWQCNKTKEAVRGKKELQGEIEYRMGQVSNEENFLAIDSAKNELRQLLDVEEKKYGVLGIVWPHGLHYFIQCQSDSSVASFWTKTDECLFFSMSFMNISSVQRAAMASD